MVAVLSRVVGELRKQAGAIRVLFASPPLRRCQLAFALARTVDHAQLVGVAAYLYEAEGVGAVAAYGVVRALAPALGVPLVTAAAARSGPGRALWSAGVAAALAAAGMAATVLLGGPLAAVLALAAAGHVALGSYRPLASTLMPSLVRTPDELVACTAAAGLLDGVTALAGPVLAGLVLVLAGPVSVLAASAALLLVAVALAAGLPVPAAMPPAGDAPARGALRTALAAPEVRLVFGLTGAQTFVRGVVNVTVVVYAVTELGLDEGAAGLLLGAIGVGALLALPLALGLTGRRLHRSIGIGVVLWGLPLAVAAGVPHLAVALVLFAVVGAGNDFLDVGAFAALPRAVPDAALARVFGLFEAFLQLTTALGAVAAGVLLTLGGARPALLAGGLLLPLLVVLCAPALRRADVRLGRRDVDVDLLRRQPLFADLPVPVLDTVAARMRPAAFPPGEVIMTQGDPGDRYVLVADGTVDVVKSGAVVARLGPGDGFGETALVRDAPRNATVVATSPVTARPLDRDAFLGALGCDPRARQAAEDVATARSGDDDREPPARA